MSSHLPLLAFINPCSFSFSIQSSIFLPFSSLLSLRSKNGKDKRSSLFQAAGALGPHSPFRRPLYCRQPLCHRPLCRRPLCRRPLCRRPRCRRRPLCAIAGASPSVPVVRPFAAAASPVPTAVQSPSAGDAEGSSSVVPAQRRYHTRVGPTLPALLHPKPAQRGPQPKRAQTSGPGESSTLRSRAPPSPPYQGVTGAPDLSPTSIIRRPYFPYDPIQGNVSYRGRDFHGEVYYDLPSFLVDSGLRDSMLLVHRYHLESFMEPRRFYYPRVVIKFYHTMTSRREANPTAFIFLSTTSHGYFRPLTS